MITARAVHCPEHQRQVGSCPACQRARLAAERQQLSEAHEIKAAADGDAGGRSPSPEAGSTQAR
jgi:hypothetical protein